MIDDTIFRVKSVRDNIELCQPVTMEEIVLLLRSLNVSKTPIPNGFTSYFYKNWKII